MLALRQVQECFCSNCLTRNMHGLVGVALLARETLERRGAHWYSTAQALAVCLKIMHIPVCGAEIYLSQRNCEG